MIAESTHLHHLWLALTQELATVYDLHGVCAIAALEIARFTRTQTVAMLEEPHGRYHDVWISWADGRLEQTRWWGEYHDYYHLLQEQALHIDRDQLSRQTNFAPTELWQRIEQQIILTTFPQRTQSHTALVKGLLCLIDPDKTCVLTWGTLHHTAVHLTTFLERAALRQMRDRQQIEFDLINHITHSLASTLKLEDIFARVADDIGRVLDTETISLALIDAHTNRVIFVPQLMGALFTEISPIELNVGEGIAGWVALHGESVIVNDVYRDNRFYHEPDKLTGFQTRSVLCVPLKSDEQVIGVLEAVNKLNGEFTEHDLTILSALSAPLATSIMNARLHQDVVSEKRRIETIFQSMAEGMLTVDAEGEITAVNDAFLTLMRRTPTEVMGQAAHQVVTLRNNDLDHFIHEVMHHDVHDEHLQLVDEVTQTDAYLPVLISGAAIEDEDGEVDEIILAFSDLRQIREVERMRDDFFHNVVHELRTPLATILMYARLLLHGRTQGDEAKMMRFLRTIEQESDRLQTMVRQMLQLAKLEASEIQRSTETMSLNRLLTEMLPPMRERAAQKGLTFAQQIEDNLPPLHGDRETIYMVFKNLIENAIKFTPTGRVKVTAYGRDEQIYIEICDEGIGIPEAAIPNLFKRFYRTQTAVERGIAGTGIGLYMVKEGVEKHRGELAVQSVEGEGTQFVVRLPVATQTAPVLEN